jgi:hypothetical protein
MWLLSTLGRETSARACERLQEDRRRETAMLKNVEHFMGYLKGW